MKILFLSLLDFDSLQERSIYTDLLREFLRRGHAVYAVSPTERRNNRPTALLKPRPGVQILKLRIGNIQKTNVIEKGITTVTVEGSFVRAIKKYWAHEKFDLLLYTTPPITLQKAVRFVKKRDKAFAYLMLKDIFPQNTVDVGMLKKSGPRGILYRYFRQKEKKLYRDSDYIGCMSEKNAQYIREHNPQLRPEKVGLCPNCIEPSERAKVTEEERNRIRERLGVPKDCCLFVYGGNLGRPQGIPFLIECLLKLAGEKRVFFLIVGSGTEYGRLDRFVKEQSAPNVKLMKSLPKEEYDAMILAADVGMIFLDYRFTVPNFPSRLLSYMDAGIPILSVTDPCTDIGDIIERGGMGWKCHSDDSESVAEKIQKIASMDDRKKFGENARRFLEEHYTAGKVCKTILDKAAFRQKS